MTYLLVRSDARNIPLKDQSVQCVVTSPPYWGLRDYGVDGQLGLEPHPDDYVAAMVDVFREVGRVLRDDGTLWLNLGDSYVTRNPVGRRDTVGTGFRPGRATPAGSFDTVGRKSGIRPKNLAGIPWRVALALQADGWILRSDIIWNKPSAMPEPVKDRPTRSHEYLFLFSKEEDYVYDAAAIREPQASSTADRSHHIRSHSPKQLAEVALGLHSLSGNANGKSYGYPDGRNKRTVWDVATVPYPGAHFAVFPPDLIEPCIKAGCPVGEVVFDPFVGSGTALLTALMLGRSGIGCDLSADYLTLAQERIASGLRPISRFDPRPAYTPLPGQLSLFADEVAQP